MRDPDGGGGDSKLPNQKSSYTEVVDEDYGWSPRFQVLLYSVGRPSPPIPLGPSTGLGPGTPRRMHKHWGFHSVIWSGTPGKGEPPGRVCAILTCLLRGP